LENQLPRLLTAVLAAGNKNPKRFLFLCQVAAVSAAGLLFAW